MEHVAMATTNVMGRLNARKIIAARLLQRDAKPVVDEAVLASEALWATATRRSPSVTLRWHPPLDELHAN